VGHRAPPAQGQAGGRGRPRSGHRARDRQAAGDRRPQHHQRPGAGRQGGVGDPLRDRGARRRLPPARSQLAQRRLRRRAADPRGLPAAGHGVPPRPHLDPVPADVRRRRDRAVEARSLRRDHRRLGGDAADLRAAREGRAQRPDLPDHRRDRHRQGDGGAGDPQHLEPQDQAVRRARLRLDPEGADRVDPVRPREGQLHRRDRSAPRLLRAGPGRHDLPRRDRRARHRAPAEVAAGARAARDQAGRRRSHGQGRRPGPGRDQPRPARGGQPRRLPRRSVLPPERDPRRAAADARAPRGHPRAGQPLPTRHRRPAQHADDVWPRRDERDAGPRLARQRPRDAQRRRARRPRCPTAR
jgi:hypothetical protein